MELIIDKEKCTGCKVCVKVCPQMILEVVDKQVQVTDIDRCMGCFGCEEECKEQAIRLLRAPRNVTKVEIEAPLSDVTECDVAVVGAGPAGLGAAITAAKGGLKVVVFDKLPNRNMCHHNDGGVMFTLPGLTSVKNLGGGKVAFPELDLTLEGDIARRIDYLGLAGPNGISSQNDFPDDIEGLVQEKDSFLKNLANLAEKEGARLWYNAKVIDVLKEGDQVCGVKLSTGEEIKSKVLVTADGIFANITEKAGFPVNREEPWYVCGLRLQFKNKHKDLPLGYLYVLGDLEPEDEMAPDYSSAQASIAVLDTIHIAFGFLTQKRYYPAPKPLDHYAELFLKNDQRVKDVIGDRLAGEKPECIVGFRARFRKECLKDTVGNGVIAVGDAWVDDCDLGNIPSLSNGVYAGRVILDAAKKNDFSKASLDAANGFLTKPVLQYVARSKRDKLSTTVLNEEEINQWFKFLPHLHYPAISFGDKKQKGKALTKFMLGNLFRFFSLIKYSKLTKYVLG